jgi:hypothetical protein
MTEERVSYIINDARCELAMKEFASYNPITGWVWEYMKLYEAITIQPKGLPAIAQCNYQGEYFHNISEFHTLFKKSMDEIDDPFDD